MGPFDRSHSASASNDAPLPPYPDEIGHPFTHTFRTMRDVLAFRDAALSTHDIARIHLFGAGDVYNFTNPSHFRKILIDERNHFGKSDDFRIAFGDGLVAAEGTLWQHQREMLQSLFSRDRTLSYVPEMAEQIHRRTDAWPDGETIDLQREMRRLTLDVLFATLFGYELELDGDTEIHTAATRLHDWFAPTSYPLPTWVPTPARRRFKRGRTRLREIADRLLSEKSADRSAGGSDTDLLSLLVELRDSEAKTAGVLSNTQLRDQVVTLIFAGHETTASTLALALYEIARHPDIREEFHAEIDSLSSPLTVEDLDAVPVTERIVTETLRMNPPVYVLPRESKREMVIDGYRIPSGVPVWLGIRQLHRDSQFYDSPDAFRPSRWDGSLRDDLPDFAYAPFGGGPRLCIGRQFALTEAKLALAIIGRKYSLSRALPAADPKTPLTARDPDSDPPLTADMTLRLAPGTEFYMAER